MPCQNTAHCDERMKRPSALKLLSASCPASHSQTRHYCKNAAHTAAAAKVLPQPPPQGAQCPLICTHARTSTRHPGSALSHAAWSCMHICHLCNPSAPRSLSPLVPHIAARQACRVELVPTQEHSTCQSAGRGQAPGDTYILCVHQ